MNPADEERFQQLRTELEQAQAWLAGMMAKASPFMQGIIDEHVSQVGVLAAYGKRGLLEAQAEYIESL